MFSCDALFQISNTNIWKKNQLTKKNVDKGGFEPPTRGLSVIFFVLLCVSILLKTVFSTPLYRLSYLSICGENWSRTNDTRLGLISCCCFS